MKHLYVKGVKNILPKS